MKASVTTSSSLWGSDGSVGEDFELLSLVSICVSKTVPGKVPTTCRGEDTNRLPKQALQYQPKGRRNIGRPRKRWRDQLHLEDQGTG